MDQSSGFGPRPLFVADDAAGGTITDNLCLSDHTSRCNMDIYVAVDRDIPDMQNVRLNGKFFSKVY